MGWSNSGGWGGHGWSRPASGGGAWTPASLPGIKGWYEGDVGVTHAGGATDTVTAWADQSGNGQNLTKYNSGLANAPIYNVNPLNGKPTIKFGSVIGQGLQNTSFNLGGSTTQLWFFAIFSQSTGSNSRGFEYLGNGQSTDGNAASAILVDFPTTTTLQAYHNGSLANTTIPASTWIQGGSVFDGTNITAYVNNVGGTPAAQGTGSFTTPGTFLIGQNPTGGNVPSMNVAAIAFGEGPILSSDQNNLHTYWLNKWATG